MNCRAIRLGLVLFLLVVSTAIAQDAKWYKGNLHTHSLWSDGDDFPEMIADWYRSKGYNFLALSDHNLLSVGQRWMPLRDVEKRGGELAMKKYLARFPDVVKTRTTNEQGESVQLQPLTKVQELLEKPGEFIMVQSEEITSNANNLVVHMNATNIAEAIKPSTATTVRQLMTENLRAVEEQSKRLNRPIVTHLNHPNFRWGVTAEDLAAVVEEKYFEVYNGHPQVNHLGDATRPGTERMWDIVNTIRLAQMNAEPVMGLGTDDAHHYHVPGMQRSTAGRGWIMLRAKELTPDAIVAGLKSGDFYASSGVTLRDVKFDPASKTLSIEIEPDGDAAFKTQFIGTPKNFSDAGKTPLDSDQVGTVFATVEGTKASYTLKGDELYIRATITCSKEPVNPSFENQKQQAWTQPVGWGKGGEAVKQ